MNKDSKIYVAGHRGLVGIGDYKKTTEGRLQQLSSRRIPVSLTCATRLPWTSFLRNMSLNMFFWLLPRWGEFLQIITILQIFYYDNLMIQNNVIEASFRYNVEKLLFLGSSCIYPKFAPQPLREESLLSGYLEPTNEAYAIAKIAGIKLCQAYHQQYGRRFISVMPTNLYGFGDNYHPQNSHVLPALIRRFHEAKESNLEEVIDLGYRLTVARVYVC